MEWCIRGCGEMAVCYYREAPCCSKCLPIIRREAIMAPYKLTSEDQERLREEMDLLESRRSSRVETAALVIQGNNIRFKTPKEFAKASGNKFGVPSQLLPAIKDDPFDF